MATGVRTTYTETANQVRSIADVIDMIDWKEAPLLKLLGINNEGKFKFVNWPFTKYEWLEDTMSPRSSTLLAAITDTGATTFAVASGHGGYFKEGDVVKVDDELMYVSAVATDTLTVTRGFGGTTAATHLISSTVTLATIARLEGADWDTGHTTTLTNPYNYTQILSEAVKVTGSEMVANKYGVNDLMAYQITKLLADGNKAGKLAILLQNIFYYGQRAVGSATAARAAGGFEHLVTTYGTAAHKIDKNSAALTRKMIEDLLELLFLAGGTPDVMVMNSWLRRKISSFYEDSIRTERTETTGGSTIKTVDTDFGSLEVVFDRWCPTDRLYMFEKAQAGWITYRPFQVIDRDTGGGDYFIKEVLGEYGFVLKTAGAHGYMYDLSTTA